MRYRTSNMLSGAVIAGCVTIAACGVDAATEDVEGQSQQLVKELGEEHTLVFEAHGGFFTVTETAPVGAPVVLPTFADKRPQAVLAHYVPSSALFGKPMERGAVVAQTQALSREEFLGGDGICDHQCAPAPHTQNPPYPYEWGESCLLDAVGGATGPSLGGEAFFWSANSRSEPGVVEISTTLVPVDPSRNPDRRTKSVSLAAGQVKYGSLTRSPNPEILGSAVQVNVTGVTGAVYDAYACSAASFPPPIVDPCGGGSCNPGP